MNLAIAAQAFLASLLAALPLLAGGCGLQALAPAPTPTASSGLETYTDPQHGFLITRPAGWTIERTGAAEGVVLALASPDGAVSIRVVRDLPPPTIDLAGYGRAVVDAMRLSLPGLEVTAETTAALDNGVPIHRTRLAASGTDPQAAELLVALRARRYYQEAFLVQATGPQPAYEAWTPSIRTALDSFFLAALPAPSPTPTARP
ncbi:MAG: hypothetical protein HY688_03075 [Chloroflexi bacterium]|nr:hypothetical protein [Chloroflexota bacterium]